LTESLDFEWPVKKNEVVIATTFSNFLWKTELRYCDEKRNTLKFVLGAPMLMTYIPKCDSSYDTRSPTRVTFMYMWPVGDSFGVNEIAEMAALLRDFRHRSSVAMRYDYSEPKQRQQAINYLTTPGSGERMLTPNWWMDKYWTNHAAVPIKARKLKKTRM